MNPPFILAQQRMRGNQAVQRMLRGAPRPAPVPAAERTQPPAVHGLSSLVQRNGGGKKRRPASGANPQAQNYQDYGESRLKKLKVDITSPEFSEMRKDARELDKVYFKGLDVSANDYRKAPPNAKNRKVITTERRHWRRLSERTRAKAPVKVFERVFKDEFEKKGKPDAMVADVLAKVPVPDSVPARSALTRAGVPDSELAITAIGKMRSGLPPTSESPKVYHGELTGEGAGTWMIARLTKGMPRGSDTSGSRGAIPWDRDRLAHRKQEPGGQTIYVLGHLLNENIGGTATAPNLVPLTAAKQGITGANDANALHLAIVEVIVKGLVERMERGVKGAPEEVQYVVVPVPRAAPRPQTKTMEDVRAAFENRYEEVKKKKATSPSVADLSAGVTFTGPMQAALRAVGSRPDGKSDANEMLKQMEENAELWAYEDSHVPERLECTVQYKQYGHLVEKTYIVQNTTPDQLDAPYEPGKSGKNAGADSTGAHGTNHVDYVRGKFSQPADQAEPEFLAALEAAQKLDKIYDASLTGTAYPKAPISVSTQERLDVSKVYWKNIKELVRKKNGAAWPKGTRPKVYHGAQSAEGSGTWMKSRLTTDMPLGSDTGASRGRIPWERDHLKYRKQDKGGQTLYVLGHLLNNNIGGTATAPNLVPLTAAEAGMTGANDANKIHVSIIEGVVKGLVARMHQGHEGDPTSVRYDVVAVQRTTPRPQTKQMKDLAGKFKKLYDDDYKNHATTPRPNVKAGLVLINAAPAKTPDQGQLARAIAAVGALGWRADNVAELMSKNAELWDYEDTHVPAELICTVEFTQYGKVVGPQTYRVPNELPDQLDAPFEEN